jgi:O-antigen/teichoic acid export membrane protein
MYSNLIRNVIISAVAYFIVSVVGLLLIPLIIKNYGLLQYGLIVQARIFLPLAALAVIDVGLVEISTFSVATAHVDSKWSECERILTLNSFVALGLGLLSGVALWVISPSVTKFVSVPTSDIDSFITILRVTALMLPLLFLSMVFEGVLKGYENFKMQRLIEVVSNLIFAILTICVVKFGLGFQWVCFSFLASLVVRFFLAFLGAFVIMKLEGISLRYWSSSDWDWYKKRAHVMFYGKVQATIQTNAPPLIIGLIIGPTGLGVYDILSRIPRTVKALLGLLNTTVQPVALKLESKLGSSGLNHFGSYGLCLVAVLALPALGSLMAFSEPILRLWLGHDIASFWFWQSVYFLVPACTVIVGFGAASLLYKPKVVAKLNMIGFFQVIVSTCLSFIFISLFHERSFILGQVIANLLTFPFYLGIIKNEMFLDAKVNLVIFRVATLTLLMVILSFLFVSQIKSILVLVILMLLWVTLCVGLCYFFAIRNIISTNVFRVKWE